MLYINCKYYFKKEEKKGKNRQGRGHSTPAIAAAAPALLLPYCHRWCCRHAIAGGGIGAAVPAAMRICVLSFAGPAMSNGNSGWWVVVVVCLA